MYLQPTFLISKLRVHEYTSGLISTPKAELFAVAKAENLWVKIKAKFVNYRVKILSF